MKPKKRVKYYRRHCEDLYKEISGLRARYTALLERIETNTATPDEDSIVVAWTIDVLENHHATVNGYEYIIATGGSNSNGPELTWLLMVNMADRPECYRVMNRYCRNFLEALRAAKLHMREIQAWL